MATAVDVSVSFDVYASALVPEFARLSFRQLAAKWYGVKVSPDRVAWVLGSRILVHPRTFDAIDWASVHLERRSGLRDETPRSLRPTGATP